MERGGEKRPGGLHGQRPKSPSDQKRDARRFEAMSEKRARAEARARELHDILGRVDGLAAGSAGLQSEIQALRARFDKIGAE